MKVLSNLPFNKGKTYNNFETFLHNEIRQNLLNKNYIDLDMEDFSIYIGSLNTLLPYGTKIKLECKRKEVWNVIVYDLEWQDLNKFRNILQHDINELVNHFIELLNY